MSSRAKFYFSQRNPAIKIITLKNTKISQRTKIFLNKRFQALSSQSSPH